MVIVEILACSMDSPAHFFFPECLCCAERRQFAQTFGSFPIVSPYLLFLPLRTKTKLGFRVHKDSLGYFQGLLFIPLSPAQSRDKGAQY